MKQLLNILNI